MSAAVPLPADVPDSLATLVHRAVHGPFPDQSDRLLRQPAGAVVRRSAVLILFADTAGDLDVLLTRRAETLRHHPGQPAFPGGALDAGEDEVDAALREAQEETGLDPAGVVPLLTLPAIPLPVSSYTVTPVIGHWATPGPVAAVDPAETAAVARVPVADLVDPANRLRLRHPSGFVGPAFDVAGLRVWGFTAALLDLTLDLGGWTRPWDTDRIEHWESA